MKKELKELQELITQKRTEISSCEDLEKVKELGEDLEVLETEQSEAIEELKNDLEERTKKEETAELELRNHQVQSEGFNPISSMQNIKEERNMKEELTKENVLASKEYRTAWAKTLMFRNDLTEAEKRALGVALTTTATEFVAPSETEAGVNNGGLFIPESVSLAILKEIELASPLLADIAATQINGNIKFPYKKSSTGAEWQIEGKPNNDESDEYAQLILTSKELAKTVRITWKLEAMAVEAFISFMITEISREMTEELASSTYYGSGINDITGATIGAYPIIYNGTNKTVMDAIGEGLKTLTARKSIGAIIYIARDIENNILFQKDDNGSYQNNPLFLNGINRIGSYTVKVDPFLKDGDFVIGNATINYKMNFNELISLTKDVSGKNRINDYTGYTVVAGAPVPGSFIHGKLGA